MIFIEFFDLFDQMMKKDVERTNLMVEHLLIDFNLEEKRSFAVFPLAIRLRTKSRFSFSRLRINSTRSRVRSRS